MKRVFLNDNWKDSWKYSYPYDLLEIYNGAKTAKEIGYSYAYQNRSEQTIEFIKQYTKKGDKILDIAAAQGNFSLKLADLGYDVTWNDIRADLVDYVEMKRDTGKITYKPGNVFDTHFDHLFDLVLATEIIEHVAHPDEFLKNLSKLVKPNGHIVISTPLGSYFKNNLPKFSEFVNPSIFESKQFMPNSDGHIFLLHTDEIDNIVKKEELAVVDLKYYTNSLTVGHMKLSMLLKVLPKKVVMKIELLTRRLPKSIGEKIHINFCFVLKKVE